MLSGPIGAGKTTVAQKLLPMLTAPVSYIEGDIFWAFVPKSGNKGQREDFFIIMRAMTAAAIPLARSGYDVLLDFSFPPDFLPVARKILKELPLDFVAVRPSLEVCEARASGRAEGKIADYAPYRSFHALFKTEERFLISDDAAAPEALATRIREGLAAGTYRVP